MKYNLDNRETSELDKLQKMLISNGEVCQPTLAIRGFIIGWTIVIESKISSILAYYYCNKDYIDEFEKKFLFDENLSFGFKINAFLKLNLHKESYKEFENVLRRVNSIRNSVAHSIPFPRIGKNYIFNSKKGKLEEIEKVYKEFLKKYTKLYWELDRLIGIVKERTNQKK